MRRTAYYKAVKAARGVQARFTEPTRKMIMEEPSFAGWAVTSLLTLIKNYRATDLPEPRLATGVLATARIEHYVALLNLGKPIQGA